MTEGAANVKRHVHQAVSHLLIAANHAFHNVLDNGICLQRINEAIDILQQVKTGEENK